MEAVLDYIEEKLDLRPSDRLMNLRNPEDENLFYAADFVDGSGRVAIHDFFDLETIKSSVRDLDGFSNLSGVALENTVPFACDRGGNYFALEKVGGDMAMIFFITEGVPELIYRWRSENEFLTAIRLWKYDGDDKFQVGKL
jgi:hypothetical protein